MWLAEAVSDFDCAFDCERTAECALADDALVPELFDADLARVFEFAALVGALLPVFEAVAASCANEVLNKEPAKISAKAHPADNHPLRILAQDANPKL